MKDYELLDAIGGIDPKYIESAVKLREKKKSIRPKLALIAVCLGLVLVFALYKHKGLGPIDALQNERVKKQDIYGHDMEEKADESRIIKLDRSEMSYESDPGQLENIIYPETTSIVRGRIKRIGQARYLEKVPNKLVLLNPQTPIEIESLEVIYGQELDTDLVYLDGGRVSADEVIKNNDEESAVILGLDKLSPVERKTSYVSYPTEAARLREGEEYIFVVYKEPTGVYTTQVEAYGIFSKSGKDFINLKTQKSFGPMFDSYKASLDQAKPEEETSYKAIEDIGGEDIVMELEYPASYNHGWELEELNANSTHIVWARVLGKNESRMVNFGDLPYTSVKLEVLSVLKGPQLADQINVDLWGGTVKVKDYISMNFEESNAKAGLYDLSEAEKEKYIKFSPESYPDLYENKEYLFFLNEQADGKDDFTYKLDLDGYSIFEIDLEKSSEADPAKEILKDLNTRTDLAKAVKENHALSKLNFKCDLTGEEFSLSELLIEAKKQ